MYAVIVTGGKQYKVEEGDVIYIEKLAAEEDSTVLFDKVVALNAKTLKVGTPYVKGASVEGKVIKNGKAKKILVYRYKAKKNVRRTQGHRQPYTKVEITLVGAGTAAKAEKAEKAEVKTEAPKKTVAKKATTKKETK